MNEFEIEISEGGAAVTTQRSDRGLTPPPSEEDSEAAGVAAPSAESPGAAARGPRVSASEKDDKRELAEPDRPRPEVRARKGPKDNRRSASKQGKEPSASKSAHVSGSASSRCRRWMHHRAGVYCKECGKVS